MAIALGSNLTRDLVGKIRNEANINTNEVVFLVSIGEDGFPNVALLSYLDISVLSSKRVILAIGENSSSKKNLARSGLATLVFWVGKNHGLYYVKGKVKLIRERLRSTIEGFACSAFLMRVEVVSKDHSSQASLVSTVTYDRRRTNRTHFELSKELAKISRRT